jgi:hypothetical protein
MKSKPIAMASLLVTSVLATSPIAFTQHTSPRRQPQAQSTRASAGPVKSPTGESFQLARSPESGTQFNVIFSDGQEQVVSGTFSVEHLQVFREVMVEAKEFAFTEASVGTDEPITMRFFSREAEGFLVDITKFKDHSQFFITMKTAVGRVTIEAGTVTRNDKKEVGFFFDILSNLEAQLPQPTGQSEK